MTIYLSPPLGFSMQEVLRDGVPDDTVFPVATAVRYRRRVAGLPFLPHDFVLIGHTIHGYPVYAHNDKQLGKHLCLCDRAFRGQRARIIGRAPLNLAALDELGQRWRLKDTCLDFARRLLAY